MKTDTWRGLLGVTGRVMLSLIFFSSVVTNKIPNFGATAEYMKVKGMPAPSFLLAGAIVFLLAGSVSLVLGYRARIGAALLLVFLFIATYYFHNFWALHDPAARRMQTIQFMKNLSMMGAMLFIIGNGAGAMSLDARRAKAAQG